MTETKHEEWHLREHWQELRILAAEAEERPEWDRVQREYRTATRPTEVLQLLNEYESYRQLNDLDKAFHKLTVTQRDMAWREVEALKKEIQALKEQHGQADH